MYRIFILLQSAVDRIGALILTQRLIILFGHIPETVKFLNFRIRTFNLSDVTLKFLPLRHRASLEMIIKTLFNNEVYYYYHLFIYKSMKSALHPLKFMNNSPCMKLCVL